MHQFTPARIVKPPEVAELYYHLYIFSSFNVHSRVTNSSQVPLEKTYKDVTFALVAQEVTQPMIRSDC